ncbi:MAG: bifunctional ADP-dependent NAD(P)H-hydrate dehydratase/NAD(P)H-hydrate epimerase [Treponema sp.]|jgi:NAD(P)H-hydrate epimerase|nr:bifunctional ADP-dependent NAD(P)H-hydrate dehydratase/NAD(P)H-hydrate epimerase [Treponema sp.]
MKKNPGVARLLLSTEKSRELDSEAQVHWGFNANSLIEAAGRSCAQDFAEAFPELFTDRPRVTVFAGTGNNGADAMVMLRYWILSAAAKPCDSILVIGRLPKDDETGPWVELFRSLKKINVPILTWNDIFDNMKYDTIADSDIIIDGIAGTGLTGPLHGMALEVVEAINSLRTKSPAPKRPFIVSVDIPSGNSEHWEPGMAMIEADLTLAVEPQKYCIYTPAARPFAGAILPVEGIFPGDIIASYRGAELLNWDSARDRIQKISPEAYKNKRGTVEIRAGSPGATGAALIAARGAQAAGAGLIRLVADDEIYPILASQVSGIIAGPASAEKDDFEGKFKPSAILLGPGWGKTDRGKIMDKAFGLEKKGVPLILDADAIDFVKNTVFNGNAIITPHLGELNNFTGIGQEELLSHPVPILLKYAKERKMTILFKAHVITIAAPDGRLGVVDGMSPGLAAGGSGDLLAGFCAAIAARMALENRYDPYNCAVAATALLIASGKEHKARFTDPLELADKAADLAGAAWLGSHED